MLPGGGLSVAVALVLLILAAAKAHGRQVRIERERAGVTAVDFRADNGPVVEAIWRRDRIRFWTAVVLVAVMFGSLAASRLALRDWPLWGALLIAAALAFASGFILAGLAVWGLQSRRRPGDPDWLERANWGSLGWWTLVAAALALVWLAVR